MYECISSCHCCKSGLLEIYKGYYTTYSYVFVHIDSALSLHLPIQNLTHPFKELVKSKSHLLPGKCSWLTAEALLTLSTLSDFLKHHGCVLHSVYLNLISRAEP